MFRSCMVRYPFKNCQVVEANLDWTTATMWGRNNVFIFVGFQVYKLKHAKQWFRRWWNSFSVMCCISYYFEFISTPFFPEYHHVYEVDLVNWSLTLQANHHVAFLSGTTFGVYIRFGASGFGKLRSCWSCAKSLMVHINDIKKDKSFGFLFDHLFVAVLFWSLKLSKDAWPPNGVVYNEITSPR